MTEWLVGCGVILAFALAVFEIPYVLGLIADKIAGDQTSWWDRWFFGIFLVAALSLCIIAPHVIGGIVLETIGGG